MISNPFALQFLEYLRKARRYSPNTLRSYEFALNAFCEFCNEESLNLESVATADALQWVKSLYDAKLQPQSINARLSALRSFYDFAVLVCGWSSNPFAPIKNLKCAKLLPLFIPADVLANVLDNVLQPTTWQKCRERLVVMFFYHTGVRCAELCGVRVRDINLQSRVVTIVGKGNKMRVVPFGLELAAAIRHFSVLSSLSPDDFLFQTAQGSQLAPWQCRVIVRHALCKIVPQSLCHPHVLRHSFATALINGGASLDAVRQLLGHASATTTQIYTHLDFAKTCQIYSQCFPRS